MIYQVSKTKLRQLPYDARLNLIKHQKDFVSEIILLMKNYPDRKHTEAENIILERGTIDEIMNFLSEAHGWIDVHYICRALCAKIENETFSATYHNISYRLPDILKIISRNQNINHLIEMFTNTCLLLHEREMEKTIKYYWPIEILMALSVKFWQNMDYNRILDYMLPYIGEVPIDFWIKKIYDRTNDRQLKERIITAQQIHDILT